MVNMKEMEAIVFGGHHHEGTANSFDGKMDEIRIYNRALSEAEVVALYELESMISSTYQIVEGKFTWDEAKADAETRGGHLASITSDKENKKILELAGVGFRANLKGDTLNLQLGFSHDINFKIPKEIKIMVEKQTIIKINGVDKELVSKIAADIKSLKPVEPYKAKGIKEKGQFVLRKEGKKK